MFVATCGNPKASFLQKMPEIVDTLKPKHVFVLFDNDEGGRKHAAQVCQNLKERTDKRGGKPFLNEFTKSDKTKKLKDMFERTKKQARQEGIREGMRELAFAFVKKGIATEQEAKQVLEETKKQR